MRGTIRGIAVGGKPWPAAKDAFATQTEMLAKLLSDDAGKDIDSDTALGIGQKAVEGISSVVLPRCHERGFPFRPRRSPQGSVTNASFWQSMRMPPRKQPANTKICTRKTARFCPDEATRVHYREDLVAHYPFHPTLIGFLNNKLGFLRKFSGNPRRAACAGPGGPKHLEKTPE